MLQKIVRSDTTKAAISALAGAVIYLTDKGSWEKRGRLREVGERFYNINPRFAKFGLDYLRAYPAQTLKKRAFRKKYGFSPPTSININPGDKCPLACKGCATVYERTNKSLPYETVENLAFQLKNLGARKITFSGGEPLAPDSYKTVYRMIDKFPHFFFTVFTNGIYMQDDIAALMEEKMNTFVFVSVDGLGEQSDASRGHNTFKHAVRAMETLQRHKVAYGVSLTVRKSNYQSVLEDETLRFFEDRDALLLFYLPFLPFDPSLGDERLTTEEQEFFSTKLEESLSRRKILGFDYTRPLGQPACRAGTRDFYVSSHGDVGPCFAITYSLGNIFKQSLEEIITSPPATAFRKLKDEKPDQCLAITATEEVLRVAQEHDLSFFSRNIENLGVYQPRM